MCILDYIICIVNLRVHYIPIKILLYVLILIKINYRAQLVHRSRKFGAQYWYIGPENDRVQLVYEKAISKLPIDIIPLDIKRWVVFIY